MGYQWISQTCHKGMLLKRGTGSGERGAGSGERGTGNGSKITSSQRYPP